MDASIVAVGSMPEDGLTDHPYGSLFSSPPWIRALSRTYGLDIRTSVLVRAGRIEAAIPFGRVADLRGEHVVCLPFSDYCDPLVEDTARWERLIAPVLAFGAPVRLRCLRNTLPCRDPRFAPTGRALWHGIDLTRSEAEIWAGLNGTARQNIRRAEREGIVVRAGRDPADLRIFHAMHCRLRKRKYRLLAQPFALFESLHDELSPADGITVLLAELDGVAVAGILLLVWRDTLYYKFNASTDQHCRPNDLLLWTGIRLGRERRLRCLDLGLSDPAQPGLVRYKRKFASEERPIHLLTAQPPASPDRRGEQAAELLRCVTRLLTEPDVPDHVTAAAGERLYRFFC